MADQVTQGRLGHQAERQEENNLSKKFIKLSEIGSLDEFVTCVFMAAKGEPGPAGVRGQPGPKGIMVSVCRRFSSCSDLLPSLIERCCFDQGDGGEPGTVGEPGPPGQKVDS